MVLYPHDLQSSVHTCEDPGNLADKWV